MMQLRWHTEAFKKSMKAAQTRLSALVMKALHRTAELGAAHARVNTLFRSRTGTLRSSIKESQPAPFASRVTASAKHARFIEEGTRPHVIRPRRKKWLRFEQNGVIRFEKSVRHPGTKPRPFMQRARDKVAPLFERLCVEAVNRMFG